MLKPKTNRNFITFNETGKEAAFQCGVMLQLLIMENKELKGKHLITSTPLAGWKTADKLPREWPYFCQYGQFV